MRKIALVALMLAGCTREEPVDPTTTASSAQTTQTAARPMPSAAEARTIIAGSTEFGEFRFTDASYSMPVSAAAMNDQARAAAKALATAGWIALDGAGDVMLNDKSRSDRRFLLRPNGLLDIVPLAKKEMGQVEAVRGGEDNTVTADFTWTWIPNEVATSFAAEKFIGTQRSTATLMWDGTKWTVLKIQ